jgi:hypothetical protein
MPEERKLRVEIRSENTSQGQRYRLTIWRPGGGHGLPGQFSNLARAERVKRCLERELGVEFKREDRDLAQLVKQAEDSR